MHWFQTHWIVLAFFSVYTVLLVRHAISGSRSTKGLHDYYVGGRAMGGVALGISFFATYASTNSFVGFSGQSFTYGLPWLLVGPLLVMFCFIGWKWIAPRLYRFTVALDSITISDFIGFRFASRPARLLSAIIILFSSILYMTAVFKGIGNLLETFIDIPYKTAIFVIFFIVMIYTAAGGFISVVKTDVVQGVIMMMAAGILFAGTVRAAGGFHAFWEVRAMPEATHLFSWDAAMPFAVLFGILVASTMKLIVEPRQLSRFYALKGEKEVEKGIWVSTIAFLGAFALLIPIGIFARHLVPPTTTDTDLIVPLLIAEGTIFPPPVGAFLIVAMIAAAMSSLDSVLLVMATTFHRDVAGLVRSDKNTRAGVRATQVYVGIFALITAVVALNPPGGIVALTSFSGSLYAACFLAPVVFGLFWLQGDSLTALSAIISGIAVLLVWPLLPLSFSIHQVFPAIFASFIVYVALALYRPANPDERLKELFQNLPQPVFDRS